MPEFQTECPNCGDSDVTMNNWPTDNFSKDENFEIVWILRTGNMERQITFCPFCGEFLSLEGING